MEYEWRMYSKRADFNQIGNRFLIDPVVARVIRNRDIESMEEIEDYLYPERMKPADPWSFADMKKAVSIMRQKLDEGKKIRIIGDYDADGVTSTFVLYKGLKRLGADVDYVIPDRVTDGYGVNPRFIEDAVNDAVDTIITCDNGIKAFEPIEEAKRHGITFIVTDHHQLDFEEDENGNVIQKFPAADAVVNPQREDCHFPMKGICGAVVAFYFMMGLYEVSGLDQSELEEFYEFIAIGTVCDVMGLVGENRRIVKHGLERMEHTNNVGLAALLEVNELNGKKLTGFHLGFVVGPCINASGRLRHAKMSMDLFMNDDRSQALTMAAELKSINDERKEMTVAAVEEAVKIVEEQHMENDKVLLIFLPNCHESLAGIVAGRIRERYYRPTLVATRAENGMAKGSARSIPGYDINMGLHGCNTEEMELKFGGHPMAAGFSLPEEKIDLLRRGLNDGCELGDEELIPKLMIDVPMPIGYPTTSMISDLEKLEPYGTANEKPVFAEANLKMKYGRLVGRNQNVFQMTLISNDGSRRKAVAFNGEFLVDDIKTWFGEQEYAKMERGMDNAIRVDVAYYPELNEYNGDVSIQVIVQKMRKH